MHLQLLVVRTPDTKRLADFYSLLGTTFNYQQHGDGPMHYSAAIGPTILEIYPLTKKQEQPDINLRLGFAIEAFEDTMETLKTNGVQLFSPPVANDFGYMAVVLDPDGRKVELYKK